MTNIACFLPCRTGSERLPNKNTKPFGRYARGLSELKLRQLAQTPEIDTIFLSTDDPIIESLATRLQISNLVVHKRAKSLCLSSTPVEDLVEHAYELTHNHDHILWTHVTTPFLNAKMYRQIIAAYFDALENGHDSLMTTTPLRTFLWDETGPLNYDRSALKWPRTQDLQIVHEINSGVHLTSREIYKTHNDRIGSSPYLFATPKTIGHDIDWPEDFQLAELILESGLAEV